MAPRDGVRTIGGWRASAVVIAIVAAAAVCGAAFPTAANEIAASGIAPNCATPADLGLDAEPVAREELRSQHGTGLKGQTLPLGGRREASVILWDEFRPRPNPPVPPSAGGSSAVTVNAR